MTFLKFLITETYKFLIVSALLLSIVISVSAKTYYFSSSTGNDSYTSTQAQSAATPWKSISKLNSFFNSFIAGDSILFKKGETFYGSIIPTVSSVIFSAYGTGSKPLLSALTTLSTWTSLGNNLWRSAAFSSANSPCVLTVNEVAVPFGRYPNSGYNYFESHSGTTSITDNQLSGTPDFTGGELVLRINGYELNRFPITDHTSGTISFSGNSGTIKDKYGYFIQNQLSALDIQNEWCYDKISKQVTIYSIAAPAKIEVSTIDNVCLIDGVDNITFKNLAFEGGNGNTIEISNANGIIIDGCDISNSGISAVSCIYTTNSVFQNCKIYNSYDDGFDLDSRYNSGIIVRSNNITKSGAVQGMGLSGSGAVMAGISISGSGHTLEYNNIDSAGYSGIIFKRGSNITIKNNVINTYCLVKQDGGGIYTWNNDVPTPTTYTNNKLIGNIIMNGIGAPEGTPYLTNFDVDGIMMDDNAGNVTITDNIITNVAGAGLYIHNNFNMTVLRNTMYNNGREQANFTHNLAYVGGVLSPYTTPLKNITFKNNILFSKNASQTVLEHYTILNDVDAIGTVDSNYFTRPINEEWTMSATRNLNGTMTNDSYNLSTWKSTYKRDAASKKSVRTIPAFTINSLVGNNLVTYGQFTNDISGLQKYSSNGNQTLSWDNTSKLTGTGSLKVVFPTVVNDAYTLLYSPVGGVSSNKNYILRVSTLGTTDTGTIRVYLRKTGSPYSTLTSLQFKPFGKTRVNHEFLFTAPVTDADAVYAIEINQNSGTTYVDNIEFYEANVSITDPDDYIRFEYNPTTVAKTIALDANYIGIDSLFYSGSITLQPFTSKILIKDTTKKVANKLSVSIAAAPIACFGGSTNIIVNASGGTAPYSGTGTNTVSAGIGSLKISFPTAVAEKYTLMYSAIGAVSAAKNYIFRFSTLGTTENGILKAYIRQTNSPYSNLITAQTATFGTARKNHEFLFTAPANEAQASFTIEVNQNSGTTYIDNVEFYEATSSGSLISSNLEDNGQFETNITGISYWSSNNNQIISWDGSSKIASTYTYIIKDAEGVSLDTSITVSQAAPVTIKIVSGIISVFGDTTVVSVTASGGTAPYKGTGSYTVTAGTYTYTVTDANGCSTSSSITITQPSATLAAAYSGGNINCFGDNTNITVSASGGVAPYTGTGTYNVNAGTGSLKLSFPLVESGTNTLIYAPIGSLDSAKNYILKFSTIGSTESGKLRASIKQTNAPWSKITANQKAVYGTGRVDHEFFFTEVSSQAAASFLIEFDQASGTTYVDNIAFFEATATGSLMGNNLFSNGQFDNDISGIFAWSENANQVITWDNTSKINDIYYYTVTDASGSKVIVEAATTQPIAALKAIATAPNITTTGGNTTVTVTASGGTAPYTGTGTFANVLAGTYNYTVIDAKGCTSTATVTVNQLALRPSSNVSLTTTPSVIAAELNVNAYPNPSSNEFNVRVEGGTTEKVNIVVSGIDGRVIFKTGGNTNQRFSFGQSFTTGIYMVQIIQGNNVKNLKLVKLN